MSTISVAFPDVDSLLRDRYRTTEVRELHALLRKQGTFTFTPLENGLFPAAATLTEASDYTGYRSIWVRDNIHIAHAHLALGDRRTAVQTVTALLSYFCKHRFRFRDIIEGNADPAEPMNRPHIRFDGREMQEIDQKWAHAQNDALGYFLWLYSQLALQRLVRPTVEHLALLSDFIEYFAAIRFWEDEDSGHWEEVRKISASSIGTATAGLFSLRKWLTACSTGGPGQPQLAGLFDLKLLDDLIDRGQSALRQILPSECIQPDPAQARRYDAALLFLIYPLQVIEGNLADDILSDITGQLQGDLGIRRYLGDSYWCENYKSALPPEQRTADFSDDIQRRNSLARPGREAQWCIFDPLVSVIHGQRYLQTGSAADLQLQTGYLNRSLKHLTAAGSPFGALRCPESYYCEQGQYVPNDITPLLWTQSNLSLALEAMHRSARKAA